MINLKAYNGRVKQTLISICQQAVSEGMTIDLLAKKLLDDFTDDRKSNRLRLSPTRKKILLEKQKHNPGMATVSLDGAFDRCPECGGIDLRIFIVKEELQDGVQEIVSVQECFKCKWSRIFEIKTVKTTITKVR